MSPTVIKDFKIKQSYTRLVQKALFSYLWGGIYKPMFELLEVKPEDNIPEGAIIDKVSLIKERNKDALKSIVHDPRYDMEVTSDNVMESFSDLVDVLNALDETRDCMCKVCEEAKALCASGEVFSKKCIIDALKIASITYVTFFGKIVKKIIDVPCDFGDACEEAKEELAPKRVF